MSLWKAYLESQQWRDRRCLHLRRRDPMGGQVGIVQPFTTHIIKEGELMPESDGVLGEFSQETDDFLRAIMDVAWDAGIRPTSFEDHANELKATRYHLEDMRVLSKVVK